MENICSCGNNIEHKKVYHETIYSKWGWFLLTVLGLSAKPKRVNFICNDCKETLLSSIENDILNKFVGR